LNIRSTKVLRSLHAAARQKKPLRANIEAEFADGTIRLEMDITPGHLEKFVKAMFEGLWANLVNDFRKYIKRYILK